MMVFKLLGVACCLSAGTAINCIALYVSFAFMEQLQLLSFGYCVLGCIIFIPLPLLIYYVGMRALVDLVKEICRNV